MTAQQQDQVCKRLVDACVSGWSDDSKLPADLIQYYSINDEITLIVNMLLRCNSGDFLNRVHVGHLGVKKFHLHAANSIWRLGIHKILKGSVQSTEVKKTNPYFQTSYIEIEMVKTFSASELITEC